MLAMRAWSNVVSVLARGSLLLWGGLSTMWGQMQLSFLELDRNLAAEKPCPTTLNDNRYFLN